ncbi:MAG: cation:proton antiporter [Pseudomonadota bacterium]
MSTAQWFVFVGMLLLLVGLASSHLQRSPLTPAIIYLLFGVLLGPSVLNWYHFNPLQESALLELLTEVAVLISLFSAGVKLRGAAVPRRWRAPILLATVSMALTVALVAGFGWFILGLPLGAAILLGAILAPTDSVLAGDIQLAQPGDHPRLRFTLACEAGMNDGSAFPFVMLGLGLLGLHELGDSMLTWLLVDVVWATVGGIAIGVVAGTLLGMLCWKLRSGPNKYDLMDDFIGLGLIGFVYGVCLLLHAWGFLAVFFAAVALRVTEERLARETPTFSAEMSVADTSFDKTPSSNDPVATVVPPVARASSVEFDDDDAPQPVSEGSVIFKEHLERLSVVLMVLLLGGTLFPDSWTFDAVGLALFIFFIARPVSVLLCQFGNRAPWRTRWLTAWFGVRGIGSLYYLMFAINHGLPENLALPLTQLTLIVVAMSIVVHGISVKPLIG